MIYLRYLHLRTRVILSCECEGLSLSLQSQHKMSNACNSIDIKLKTIGFLELPVQQAQPMCQCPGQCGKVSE